MVKHGNALGPNIDGDSSNQIRTWRRVLDLCTRKTPPTRAEVKAVLPTAMYRRYEKRRTRFKEHRAFDSRPQILETITRDLNSLSRKIGSTQVSSGTDKLEKQMREFERAQKRLASILKSQPSMRCWLADGYGLPSGNPRKASKHSHSSFRSFRLRSLASVNKAFKENYPDSAEREAVQEYLLHIFEKSGQTREWRALQQAIGTKKNTKRASRRYGYTVDLLETLTLQASGYKNSNLQGVRTSHEGQAIVFGKVDTRNTEAIT